MKKIVLGSVVTGILAGIYLLPNQWFNISGNIITFGLCGLLFFVGIDIGLEGNAYNNIKKAGIRILLFPIATIIGTYLGALVSSLFLPISAFESIVVSSGFGWYTLAPVMIAEKSAELSAFAFLHNVFREMIAIMTIPFIAKKVGNVESICLPGAAAMDVCLPLVEKTTNGTVAVYSFLSGVVLSAAVPILVSMLLPFL